MKLTSLQEEELLNQYDRLIWQTVHRYNQRQHTRFHNNLEDLHSECVLVFLKHIRACETPEQIKRFPFRDMINAMCLFVLGEQALTYPKRTANFRQVMEQVPVSTSLDCLASVKHDKGEQQMRDIVDVETFKEFCASLPPREQYILQMKTKGCKNREIAVVLGVSDAEMTRTLKKLCGEYRAYAA